MFPNFCPGMPPSIQAASARRQTVHYFCIPSTPAGCSDDCERIPGRCSASAAAYRINHLEKVVKERQQRRKNKCGVATMQNKLRRFGVAWMTRWGIINFREKNGNRLISWARSVILSSFYLSPGTCGLFPMQNARHSNGYLDRPTFKFQSERLRSTGHYCALGLSLFTFKCASQSVQVKLNSHNNRLKSV